MGVAVKSERFRPMRTLRGQASGAILVVDDDPMCCRLMAAALELDGHRVDWTTDPEHAIELVRARQYVLVISDVNMPRMLGTALVAQVGRIRPGLQTILVSAFADREVHAEAKALGTVLLPKPLRVDALTAAVREVLYEQSAGAAAT
jgi:two-component system, response regulator YesN